MECLEENRISLYFALFTLKLESIILLYKRLWRHYMLNVGTPQVNAALRIGIRVRQIKINLSPSHSHLASESKKTIRFILFKLK